MNKPITDTSLPLREGADLLRSLAFDIAKGDQNAFARLYELTSSKLYSICLSIIREPAAADEALQETYLRIWKYIHKYDAKKGHVMGWLVTIARNTALRKARMGGRKLPDNPYDLQNMMAQSPDPFQQLLLSIESRDVFGCLQGLDKNQQKSIVLAYLYGFTHPEIAARLDAPIGTVKSWIRRGLIGLRHCLNGETE